MSVALFCTLLACLGDTGETTPAPNAESGGTDTSALAPPEIVLFITVDSVNRNFYGVNHVWNTTPRLDALFAQSVVIPDAVVPRGVTTVSLTALTTGRYPRTTDVRRNEIGEDEGASLPTGVDDVFKVFHDNGWQTVSLSSNQCGAAEYYPDSVDHQLCTAPPQPANVSQADADVLLMDEAAALLQARTAETKLFLRIHLAEPHYPYDAVEPYFSEYYPGEYTGTLKPEDAAAMEAVILANAGITEDDRAYLNAVYASQLRRTDDLLGTIFDQLTTLGIDDKTMIVFGSDHGDELASNGSDYMYHGCSAKQTVLGALFSIRMPGLPPGQVPGYVPTVDILPTVLELTGLPIQAGTEGQSILANLWSGEAPNHPAYFERGLESAGVVIGNLKVFLNPGAAYAGCIPFDASGQFYPNDALEAFDLAADPFELTNLANSPTAESEAAFDSLCGWVLSTTWSGTDVTDGTNPLVRDCLARN